jgi:hypothetical protein
MPIYYLQFVKKSKAKPKKKAKTAPISQPPKKSPKASTTKKATPAPKPKPAPAADSFFAFGGKDDSDDSDSEEEETKPGPSQGGGHGKVFARPTSEFKLGDGLGDLHDDMDDDLGNGGMAATWNLSKPVTQSAAKDGDEDHEWGAAREEAAAVKVREADRKAREEKIQAEAELVKTQRLADAAVRGKEVEAERLEKEANEALKREQHEKEADGARKAARDAARAQVQSVEQTVDLDAQRDIMEQYEKSFLDKDIGSASPSSDFGF